MHLVSIDLFCYFSHNLVTISQISLINAPHHHGTSITGTFIKEWDQGISIVIVLVRDTISKNSIQYTLPISISSKDLDLFNNLPWSEKVLVVQLILCRLHGAAAGIVGPTSFKTHASIVLSRLLCGHTVRYFH